MKALRIGADGVRLADVAPPSDGSGHGDQPMALVRVQLAGVCNTDLEIARGYMGFVGTLGHEFIGSVEGGPEGWLGERVVAEINYGCGRCERCAKGLARHCAERLVMGIQGADGAFAERIAVPVANLHRVPPGVPDEAAVFTEPLAAAFEILEQLEIERGEHAVVFGDGKLGSLVARVLAHAGCEVSCVGKHAEKLAPLAKLGLRCFLLDDWLRAAEPRAPLVVDATGSAAGIEMAIAATAPRGRLVLKSTVAGRSELDLAPLVIHEIELRGSRCGVFGPAIAALESNAIEVASLVDERIPLARGVEAFEAAARPGARKILIECE